MEVGSELAELLKNGQLKEALALASKKEFRGSHLARVTAAGIEEYLEGKSANLTVEEQLEAAQRGCERAQALFSLKSEKGTECHGHHRHLSCLHWSVWNHFWYYQCVP